MSEWEEKLNTLLSDPDAMAQVMNMAQNLSQQMGQSGGSSKQHFVIMVTDKRLLTPYRFPRFVQ